MSVAPSYRLSDLFPFVYIDTLRTEVVKRALSSQATELLQHNKASSTHPRNDDSDELVENDDVQTEAMDAAVEEETRSMCDCPSAHLSLSLTVFWRYAFEGVLAGDNTAVSNT